MYVFRAQAVTDFLDSSVPFQSQFEWRQEILFHVRLHRLNLLEGRVPIAGPIGDLTLTHLDNISATVTYYHCR